MADFKETMRICQHNGILGHLFHHYDFHIIKEDLADGTSSLIKWGTALDTEHISKVLMDWADSLETGRRYVSAFCQFDFNKHQYITFKETY